MQTGCARRERYKPNDRAPDKLGPKTRAVRRRIGSLQKRRFNERKNYSYVTSAGLAGSVGIPAELGVVIVPGVGIHGYENVRNAARKQHAPWMITPLRPEFAIAEHKFAGRSSNPTRVVPAA